MISKIEALESKLNFPVARKWKNTDLVVIFSDTHRGLVVAVGDDDEDYELGSYKTDWICCNNTQSWEPVELTVTG